MQLNNWTLVAADLPCMLNTVAACWCIHEGSTGFAIVFIIVSLLFASGTKK